MKKHSNKVEYGGYLPLELSSGKEYHSYDNLLTKRLNTGRTAIWYALKQLKPKRVLCPDYYCPSVIEAITSWGYEIKRYPIGFNLLPIIEEVNANEDDAIILVNYFGILGTEVTSLASMFQKAIIDQCLGFFEKPLIDESVVNIYSCRKFFGVTDGAYAVLPAEKEKVDLKPDSSWRRFEHILASVEEGTNFAYAKNKENEKAIGKELLGMSPLTNKILESIDYKAIKEVRKSNFRTLDNELKDIQKISLNSNPESPWCYPLVTNTDGLREALVREKVYVPWLWDELADSPIGKSPAAYFSHRLCCLPIDQRYDSYDMKNIADIVIGLLKEAE